MRRRPETEKLQLRLQSWRGQGRIQMYLHANVAVSLLNVFIEFWLIIIAAYLFIYL